MSAESKSEVEKANAAFYRALESGEIERMDEVWAHEDWVRCVHPGWDLVAGWSRVRESWELIFRSGQRLRASPSNISIWLSGDLAWVTCTENVTVFSESSFESAQAVATNLFIRRAAHWLMIHHHASPVPMIVADVSSDLVQ